ncbi:uncharacterized protein LOC126824581 [Patella vulgata]|uniref:uncharacterized protein LOC126824581 n=1 Tax=Patella vulgata TaxID=6465 RepID=UPI00217FED8F|nr:uncharacterized protein LOC126824581 [Patella vulgata]
MGWSISLIILLIFSFEQAELFISGNATCDNQMLFYADGVQYAESVNWWESSPINIPDNTTVVAIKCQDTGDAGGIKAALDNGIKTDVSWKCSDTFEAGWNQIGFDDSAWSVAVVPVNDPWNSKPASLVGKADWIWILQTTGQTMVVYCRKVINLDTPPTTSSETDATPSDTYTATSGVDTLHTTTTLDTPPTTTNVDTATTVDRTPTTNGNTDTTTVDTTPTTPGNTDTTTVDSPPTTTGDTETPPTTTVVDTSTTVDTPPITTGDTDATPTATSFTDTPPTKTTPPSTTTSDTDAPPTPLTATSNTDTPPTTTSGADTKTHTFNNSTLKTPSKEVKKLCGCNCIKRPNPNQTNTLQAKVTSLQKDLKVTVKSLSSTIRRKKSAADSRVSSSIIGTTSTIILICTMGVMVVADIPTIAKHIYSNFCDARKKDSETEMISTVT